MGRQRDYKREYRKRLERAQRQGFSPARARGHGGPRTYDPLYESGLKAIRAGRSLSEASRASHLDPERLRDYLQTTGVAKKVGGRWRIGLDRRPRSGNPIFSRGRRYEITVADYESARLAGLYMHTVHGLFLESNDPTVLTPFAGQGVYDTRGRHYPFELRPNELYRLTLAGPEPYERIYRVVM